MKKVLLAAALMLSGAFAASAQSDSITNGGFERWTGGNPDGWTVNQAGNAVRVTSVSYTKNGTESLVRPVYMGKYALQLKSSATAVGGISQRIALDSTKNSIPAYFGYTWSWLPTIQGERGGIVGLVVYNSVHHDTAISDARLLGPSEPWQNFSVELFPLIRSTVTHNPDSAIVFMLASIGNSSNQVGVNSSLYISEIGFRTAPYTGINDQTPLVSGATAYPNPFTGRTTLTYNLENSSMVTLSVYDMTGREVSRLVDGMQTAGQQKAEFDGSDLRAGVYTYRLQAGNSVQTGKLMLTK